MSEENYKQKGKDESLREGDEDEVRQDVLKEVHIDESAQNKTESNFYY